MAYLPYESSMGFKTGGGLRVYLAEVTLSSGTADLVTPLTQVVMVLMSHKDATAVAEGLSWSVDGSTVTVDSSNASSAEVVSVMALGY